MIKPLVQGLLLTLRYFFSKDVTLRYPEEKWPVAKRWRGRHVLTVHPSGKVKCVACMLCATVCPAECISITAAAEPDNRKYRKNINSTWGGAFSVGTALRYVPKRLLKCPRLTKSPSTPGKRSFLKRGPDINCHNPGTRKKKAG